MKIFESDRTRRIRNREGDESRGVERSGEEGIRARRVTEEEESAKGVRESEGG